MAGVQSDRFSLGGRVGDMDKPPPLEIDMAQVMRVPRVPRHSVTSYGQPCHDAAASCAKARYERGAWPRAWANRASSALLAAAPSDW